MQTRKAFTSLGGDFDVEWLTTTEATAAALPLSMPMLHISVSILRSQRIQCARPALGEIQHATTALHAMQHAPMHRFG